MSPLPIPPKESIFYEDEKLYACLALYPFTKGHTVVVWKEKTEDLHLLSKADYEYLMDKVDSIRNTLLEYFNLEKVYLMYMDEARQVHWHLVPRYNEQGVNVLTHHPEKNDDFSIARDLEKAVKNQF